MLVPTIVTLAPGRGSPLSLSRTRPLTEPDAAPNAHCVARKRKAKADVRTIRVPRLYKVLINIFSSQTSGLVSAAKTDSNSQGTDSRT